MMSPRTGAAVRLMHSGKSLSLRPMLCNTLLLLNYQFSLSTVCIPTWRYKRRKTAVVGGWWVSKKLNSATNNRSPQLYRLLSSGLKESWTCRFRENPAKHQITLLHRGLRPVGKGALVVTGGPEGNGADGRFRRLEVGLCIMWLAFAVTVSLLSPPRRGSDPQHPSYLRVRLSFCSFPSRNPPSSVDWGSVAMWKVTLFCLPFFPHFNRRSCKEAIFLVSSGNHLRDLISRHAAFITRSTGFLLTLSTLRIVIFWSAAKSNKPSHWKATAYLCFQVSFVRNVSSFRAEEKPNVEI